jgi:hypothetical protein
LFLEGWLRLERDQFDGRLRLGLRPGLWLRDQSLAEASRRHLGAIAAALDGQIGALTLTRAIAASIAIAVSRALFDSFDVGWIARRRAERSIAASIAIAVSVSRALFDYSFAANWIAWWRAERRVKGIRGRWTAAGIAASISVALPTGVTAAFAFARRGRIG